MAQKVWVLTLVRFNDEELELLNQEAFDNIDDADVRWNEIIPDIGCGMDEYDADNHICKMSNDDRYYLLTVRETELQEG